MKIKVILLLLAISGSTLALEAEQILVVANGNNIASLRVAEYYCQRRGVPVANILKLKLPEPLADNISRAGYETQIAGPVRDKLAEGEFAGQIKCLLTVYGVPFKVGPRGIDKNKQKTYEKLQRLVDSKELRLRRIVEQLESMIGLAKRSDDAKPIAVKKLLAQIDSKVEKARRKIYALSEGSYGRQMGQWQKLHGEIYGYSQRGQLKNLGLAVDDDSAELVEFEKNSRLINRAQSQQWDFSKKVRYGFYTAMEKATGIRGMLLRANSDIDNIRGVETNASVDSELSMINFGHYELYRWQPNELFERVFWFDTKTLMVARLDGPDEDIAIGLVDKAIAAERGGLKGRVYIDSGHSANKRGKSLFAEFDKSMEKTAHIFEQYGKMKVVLDKKPSLFAVGSCPQAAIYCGWYSLKNYIDAFDFLDGAIAYHIASFEAVNLRDPASGQWCPSVLADGAAVTIGAVAEPYLSAFPKPDKFMSRLLLNGNCIVEAYYRTKPFNSWQMILIGDPLYKPFP